MITPSETQFLILSRASRRPGNLALPLPDGLVGAAAKMVVGKMTTRGWLEEVEANLQRGEPLWRETGDGHGMTLIATAAGLEAIEIEPIVARAVASAVASARRVRGEPEAARADATAPSGGPTADTSPSLPVRAGTKQAQVIALLQRPEGATIAEIAAVTGWQAHTVRGAISGALKKKLRLPVTSEKVEGRGIVHRIS